MIFSVHNQVRIKPDDNQGLENLSQHIIRNTFSLEFIAAITQHISEQSFQLVRYYGWYSNRMRGDRKTERGMGKGEDEVVYEDRVIDIRNYKPKRIA